MRGRTGANLLPGLELQCREEVRPIYHPDKAGDRDSAQIFPNLETHQQPAKPASAPALFLFIRK